MNVTVPTPEFCETINTEQSLIKTRCEEIDGTVAALEDERLALEERTQALEMVKTLYKSSQQTMEDSLAVQARLNVSHEELEHVEEGA